MHAPASLDEAAALLHELAGRERTVGITGGERPGGPAAVAVDEVVSTRALDAIVEYVPADQIVTVQAGVTVARLQAALRERRQRLSLDPPVPERTTIGGAVACASYGPLRTRYGTAKDAIVGMSIVRADGVPARGGGKVVKNVAGFDIPKLMVGTYGTLAMIGTVTFRLHPLPAASSEVIVNGCTLGDLRSLVHAIIAAQLEPSAIYATYDATGYACCVRFEGFPEGVKAQRDALLALAKRDASEGSLEADHERARAAGSLQVKITVPPSAIEELHAQAVSPLYRALDGAHAAIYPTVCAAFVSGEAGDGAGVLSALTAARTFAERSGGNLVTLEAPSMIRASFDSWGTPPPSYKLMRALKARFDPKNRLNPGGFVGGL
ncbi:MAG TPA: FAD-binding oxidoreductase [Candidatus Acidoferrales bacterium]|nr:FAD-binding oxidoreductase [Candidatus Acidoferrales bacterium]